MFHLAAAPAIILLLGEGIGWCCVVIMPEVVSCWCSDWRLMFKWQRHLPSSCYSVRESAAVFCCISYCFAEVTV
jgi:hypothetical protein